MRALERLIELSVKHRFFVVLGVLVFAGIGILSFQRMTFDAFPDLTNVQVQVLTSTPGMGSTEVERQVTMPLERALGGTPKLSELRSISRPGVSSVTVVFEDGTEPWRARQMVRERVDLARDAIPDTAGVPELAPSSTGLGEIYQFTLSSDRHTSWEVYRIFERDIAPRLRTVPGVVEVNAWGGGSPELEVAVDPFALAAYGLEPADVETALAQAGGLASGGALARGGEQIQVRGEVNPADPEAIAALPLRTEHGRVVRIADVATVQDTSAMTVGLGSSDGRGEVMFVMVQLLAGADALGVVEGVRGRMDEIEASLPAGVEVGVVYDRSTLVRNTLSTVTWSLVEGGALVIVVLLLLLGDLRAGLLVASVIPLAMLGAFTGMYVLGYSGNLMSLGAIDFGLIVDGSIVVTESIVALSLATGAPLREAVAEQAKRVARPVLFAVGILLLVYTPVLMMWGTEGKLFRPMALTVLLALFTALVLSFTWVPAVASWVVKPKGHHQTWIVRALVRIYRPVLDGVLARPVLAGGIALGLIAASTVVGAGLGVEFVPRLEEGDLVVQTARVPSLNNEEALAEATRVEQVLMRFSEVERVASRTGSPAVATDPMGLEEADILIKLHPRDEWAHGSTAELVEAMTEAIERDAPGAELTFTQPIEMRFSELLEGITSDVGIKIYGPDLAVLNTLAAEMAATLEGIDGAADVTAPIQEGLPTLDVQVRPEALARHGITATAVLEWVEMVRRGREVATVRRAEFRDPVVMRVAMDPAVPLASLPVPVGDGLTVPLSELADVVETESPNTILRDAGSRRVVVEANVRGRDLGAFVGEAHDAVSAIELPPGYWIEWSGKYEQMRTAAWRTGVLVPVVLFVMLGILYVAFDSFRPALLIFLNVPIAASGGVFSLAIAGLPVSMSAVVGFIALFGVAVMNGIVLLSRTRELHVETDGPDAARTSALERFRPVLMTALVAGIGFVPMAFATGVGSEVQRPLAIVVIGGLITSTLLTLIVLPSLYARLVPPPPRRAPAGEDPRALAAVAVPG